ncbi:hypothetical protein ACNKHX_23810 [Shigella flexneri]
MLAELAKRGIERVQIDEPALVLELPQAWPDAYKPAYDALQPTGETAAHHLFEGVTPNLDNDHCAAVQGLHVDLVHGKDYVAELHKRLPSHSVAVLCGLIGWSYACAPMTQKYAQIRTLSANVICGVASSRSLLHSPIDLSVERVLIRSEKLVCLCPKKCDELALLRHALKSGRHGSSGEPERPDQHVVTYPRNIIRW